jgi:predicted DsbA family dithiol-disulfide isomerase
MHHSLFERMEQWSTTDDLDGALTRIAADLALDTSRFSACLAGRQALERVWRDMNDGGRAIGIRNVPSFLVLRASESTLVSGARPTEQFVALMQRFLDRTSATAPGSDARGAGGR